MIHILLCTITLEIPSANTLKDKRSILQRLLNHIRNGGAVSICEAGFQNRIRSAVIAGAVVGISRTQCERAVQTIEAILENSSRVSILEVQREWL